jgi:hypothetical protein
MDAGSWTKILCLEIRSKEAAKSEEQTRTDCAWIKETKKGDFPCPEREKVLVFGL